jgi:fructokinase
VKSLKVSADLLVVGHFALDTIYKNEKLVGKFLGGPPTYVSLAAAKLGVRVSILSKVGHDFKKGYIELLTSNLVDLSLVKNVTEAETTKFELRYSDWTRELWLKAMAPPLKPEDLPKHLRVKAIHVAPIANEIQPKLVEKLREKSELLSLDPQGFLREFDRKGKVRLKMLMNSDLMKLLDIYKSSFNEIKALTGRSSLEEAMQSISNLGISIVIVTLGAQGSVLLSGGKFYRIPSASSEIVRDVTGAGDAYIGGFLAEYIHGKDVVWCGSVGSAAASFVVEGLGSSRFGERSEVYERAEEVYNKVCRKGINADLIY